FGAAVKRREDPRLITGQATYVDDIQLPGMVYAAFVRSPHGHARITGLRTDAARAVPGVVSVVTGKDVAAKLGNLPCAWLIPGSDLKPPAHPILASETVRYVGDAVAVVVGETRAAARDGASLVEVDYEPLPVIIDQEKATKAGAPQLHSDVPNNVAFHWK